MKISCGRDCQYGYPIYHTVLYIIYIFGCAWAVDVPRVADTHDMHIKTREGQRQLEQ